MLFSVLFLSCLLVTGSVSAPSASSASKIDQKIRKRDINSSGGGGEIPIGSYQNQITPGMVDDQVAEALLKDAAAGEGEEEEEGEGEGSAGSDEMPLSLPMSGDDDDDLMLYPDEPSPAHRSRALPDDVYPVENDDAYLPYYPTDEIYFRRRRRSRPAKRLFRKRSVHAPLREVHKIKRSQASRRKRQIRLSDEDLEALIQFLIDLKLNMERSSSNCNNPAHHSFFRENELNEELGAGSGIDEDYSDVDLPPASEQEYPLWLMPHTSGGGPRHGDQLPLPVPQRRSLYYPTNLPGQKRAPPLPQLPRSFHYPKYTDGKMYGIGGSSEGDFSAPRRFFQ